MKMILVLVLFIAACGSGSQQTATAMKNNPPRNSNDIGPCDAPNVFTSDLTVQSFYFLSAAQTPNWYQGICQINQ